MKNALDPAYVEWNRKIFGIVSDGPVHGTRADGLSRIDAAMGFRPMDALDKRIRRNASLVLRQQASASQRARHRFPDPEFCAFKCCVSRSDNMS